MSNVTGEDDQSFSSENAGDEVTGQQPHVQASSKHAATPNTNGTSSQPAAKKRRNLPGNPDPTAEVVALSPTTLMATNRFICEICNKGFQRDQNLQLHRRGHNLPWKLKQRTTTDVRKRVYICPEPSCVHHNPARALGDLTGIKKHFSRKHGEKKWKCDKCSKKYAVQSDWKAHQKTCGTREYKCDCGTIFSRRDSFITHRAFCDALAEENNKVSQGLMNPASSNLQAQMPEFMSNPNMGLSEFNNFDPKNPLKSLPQDLASMPFKPMNMVNGMFSTTSGTLFNNTQKGISSTSSGLQLSSNSPPASFNIGNIPVLGAANMSATALLQKAAQMGATTSNSNMNSAMMQQQKSFVSNNMAGPDPTNHGPTSFQNSYPIQGDEFNNPSQMLFNKSPQEVNQMFDSGNNMNDMGLFGGMLMGTDQNPAFMKSMDQSIDLEDSSHQGLMQGRNAGRRSPSVASMMSRGTGNDVTTVDFLGIGGSRQLPPASRLHEQQQQQQHRLDQLEAMSQHRMHPFQHQLSHGEYATDKALWDV